MINLEELLEPISDEAECGPNLEYDPRFQALEALVDQEGEIEWRDVLSSAEELCAESRDLRIGIQLARATLAVEGFVAFGNVMAVLRTWQERFWDSLHPELDGVEEGLPQLRVNCLATLSADDQNPKKIPSSTLTLIKNAAFVEGSRVGKASLRDYQIASGDLVAPIESSEGGEEGAEAGEGAQTKAVGLGTITAIFNDVGPEGCQASFDGVRQAIEALEGIAGDYDEHLGYGVGPNFADALKLLQDVGDVIAKYGGFDAPEDNEEGEPGADGVEDGHAASGGVPGTIGSREDAILALDRVSAYFERTEPSSPVPLILRRAKSLVSKSFLEVLQDLSPDAVYTVEQIVGSQSAAPSEEPGEESSWD